MKYARLVDGQAVDVVAEDPATLFHPDIAAEFVRVPDDTGTGDMKNGKKWIKYVPPPPPEPVPPIVAVSDFKLLLLPFAHEIAAAAATDGRIAAFVNYYEDVRLVAVDLSLSTIQDSLRYSLAAIGKNESEVAECMSTILKGTAQ